MSKTFTNAETSSPDWATPSGRIAWLAESRFDGNRSAMARAIGFSHAIISKVICGDRKPGRRLFEAVSSRLGVDPVWLEKGRGQPFDAAGVGSPEAGMPVTKVMLPGRPLDHQDQISGGWGVVPGVEPSPTRYWLVLSASEPVVRAGGSGFLAGDHLLMEAEPAEFPGQTQAVNQLCVVRDAAAGGRLRLAHLEYHEGDVDSGPARLVADYHDTDRPEETIIDDVYRTYPEGEIRHFRRYMERDRVGNRSRIVPKNYTSGPVEPTVPYTSVVAVWLGILHRPLG